MALRDFLERFRPVASPGAATGTGVPVDAARRRETELEPVFRVLAETRAECARILAEARTDAESIRARATAEAVREVTVARERLPVVRAEAEARTTAAAYAEAAEVRALADRDAERERRLAEERMPALVERALSAVLALREPGR